MKNDEQDFNYQRYAEAVEESLTRVAAKNGIVRVNQIELETSVPKELIVEVLDKSLVDFPGRVKEVVDKKGGNRWKK